MSKRRLIVATHNAHKMQEIRSILQDRAVELEPVSLADIGFNTEIVEDGESFEANARIKMQAIASQYPRDYVMADDSGLCVDCLGGQPGIYSARFMGEKTPYDLKNAELIRMVNEQANAPRSARFVCCVACRCPDSGEFVVTGVMEGAIAQQPAGVNGFGYDPIFYLAEYGCTAAELTAKQKNQISHRGKALALMAEELARRIVAQSGRTDLH